ncbi:MAG TPA: MOSC domain-containing protein [Candidatus Binataceae bacterium]|nr:MOSC domain-containing protein [Candidatus Binataceae bacterium]
MNSAGEIVAIARHIRQRAPIEELDSVRITLESGVEGDCHGDPGPSQVTLVSEEAWRDAIADLGITLPWTLRRANVLVRGVDLFNTSGLRLHLGDVVLEITGENDPCWLMDKQHRGLRKALTPRWRAGVACRVIKSGIVEVGDRVSIAAEL